MMERDKLSKQWAEIKELISDFRDVLELRCLWQLGSHWFLFMAGSFIKGDE
jgi:hypothetical protein